MLKYTNENSVAIDDISAKIIAAIEFYKKDAERYRFLESQAKEVPLNKNFGSEEFPDLRTRWELPTLICSGPVGGYLTFDEAVDVLMNKT